MKIRFFSVRVLPALVSFALLLSACGGGEKPKENEQKQETADRGEVTDDYLAEHYYPKPFEVSTHMGEADDYQKALGLYNEGKFNDAIPIFEKLLPMKSAEGQMALANAYMQTKQYDKAVPHLKKAAEDANFSNEAKQYLIVSYVMAKQIQFAKLELEAYLKNTNLTPKDKDWAEGLMADLNKKAAQAKP